ncbi:TetR/AcrR family transcriptional regulator [Pseudonocardia sp. RS11V-5]|uniref:TetR/AcrR family transcriptional regulator n=1 Tax=Pseudonocardia terrae TaxID=2905831 RepID=UPI001E4F3D90|nr:TetR/AcrR family transcriptional regulator [Pseudonocardia terrae]MCE3550643.1 TetR/AcrR family transcriptional regulator [Pseudonocardia terrae]
MTAGTGWEVRGARDRVDSPTRHRLLRAAEEAFAAKGFGAVTVADVTEGAGVGRATFYVYFATKADVFAALAADVRDQLCAAQDVPDTGDAFAVWRAALDGYLRAWTARIGLLRVMAHQAIEDPAIRTLLEEIRAVPTRRHERFVTRLEREGRARPRASAALTAQAVQGVIERYAELVAAGELSADDAVAALAALYEGMVRF